MLKRNDTGAAPKDTGRLLDERHVKAKIEGLMTRARSETRQPTSQAALRCRFIAALAVWQSWLGIDGSFATPVSVSRFPLQPSQCSGRFVATDLPHEIEVDSPRVFNFESLGAGLALGDLDNDGDIDLVLANLDGATIILWNERLLPHGPGFRPQELTSDPTAGVVAADVDGDGWLDLTLTHPQLVPSLYRNAAADSGHREFARDRAFGAGYHAYVLDWGDLDGDGDLDLVTATYDRLLQQHYGFVAGGGVAFYENTEDGLDASLLIPGADALALLLADLDGDRRPEIVVGNDYARRDYVLTRA